MECTEKSLLHPINKEHRDHTADMAECIEDSSGLAAGRSGNEKAKAFKCCHLRHRITLWRQREVRKQDPIGDFTKGCSLTVSRPTHRTAFSSHLAFSIWQALQNFTPISMSKCRLGIGFLLLF